MPRLSKKEKEEWAFFINDNGRRQYNDICRQCARACMQSYRAGIVFCPMYQSKRAAV
ncbi:MAG: hypothetical protein PUK21_01215 [Peptostreptococcaceae bacterium]|nr:hypothetical protein [Peptostreptococcaceae bacterium]MDY5739628.1 hypothetical protein [Anaerovoracaceae bacterium]